MSPMRKTAGKKVAATRKRNAAKRQAAAKKAASTRKGRAAGKKVAKTRVRQGDARKAAPTRARKKEAALAQPVQVQEPPAHQTAKASAHERRLFPFHRKQALHCTNLGELTAEMFRRRFAPKGVSRHEPRRHEETTDDRDKRATRA